MPGALHGVRVLDLSWGIAGPLGVLLLAEQGADVIKVEPPGGDPFRDYSGYAVWNRSRRSVTVDLKQPAGADAFRKLAADADVLVETFRPGVTDRLGIGFDALHELESAARVLLVPRVPRRPPARGTARVRRARAGEQRPAVGAARVAAGADLLAHADAEHGRDVPRSDGHHQRADRRVSRPVGASTCGRRCSRVRCCTPRRSGPGCPKRPRPSTARWPRRIRPACTRR